MESFLQGTIFSIVATATAMTGGVTAGPGQEVVTDSSYSSVEIRNIIHSSEGTSKTTITTTENGETHTQTISRDIEPDGLVEVITATSASSGKGVRTQGTTSAEVTRTHPSSSIQSFSITPPTFIEQILSSVSHIIGSFWSLFRF